MFYKLIQIVKDTWLNVHLKYNTITGLSPFAGDPSRLVGETFKTKLSLIHDVYSCSYEKWLKLRSQQYYMLLKASKDVCKWDYTHLT